MPWHYIEQGTGRPIVLLHGLGSGCEIWQPIMERLAENRRVIAFDLPGHGKSPTPPPGEPLGPEPFAKQLGAELLALGIDEPVDFVGNSLGGWTALEAAKLGIARSVVGLSPAGLWRGGGPKSSINGFRTFRSVVRRYPRLVEALLQRTVGRTLLLPLVFGRPWRMPGPIAIEHIRMFDQTTIVDEIFAQSFHKSFTGGTSLRIPITIAFGTRDWLLNARTCQFPDELPVATRWIKLSGCGHCPMWDDPQLIVSTVLAGTI